ncbi:MAG: type II toxin-antitoxin system HicB family antitoxin [Pseudoramibacter sp.]
MAKYLYPAVFTTEPDGSGISVNFPDIPQCYTGGRDMNDALDMAEDVLNMTLLDMEENGDSIPKPSNLKSIPLDENSAASLVRADTLAYRKQTDNKAVKKTLTIPAWMDTIAKKNNINFSQVLQDALTEKLHLEI